MLSPAATAGSGGPLPSSFQNVGGVEVLERFKHRCRVDVFGAIQTWS